MSKSSAFITKIFVKSLLATILFILIYSVYIYLNHQKLMTSGYDADRFYRLGLSGTLLDGLHPDNNMIMLVNYLELNNFIILCPILYFFIILIASLLRANLLKILLLYGTTPLLVFCFETGKDFLIIVSLLYYMAFFYMSNAMANFKRGMLVIVGTISILLCSVVLFVKGLTALIYYYAATIFFVRIRFRKLFMLGVIPAFLLSYEIRGFVKLEDIAMQSSFGIPFIVSTEFGFSLVYEFILRALVILSAPLWYWLYALYLTCYDIGAIFSAVGYSVLGYLYFSKSLYVNKIIIFCAFLFAVCFPFVHLRYFFTFIISYLLFLKIFTNPDVVSCHVKHHLIVK